MKTSTAVVNACTVGHLTDNPMGTVQPRLDELWNANSRGEHRLFDPDAVPAAARKYLAHAIASGAALSRAVRLRMHGEIKLKRWYPFTAEEVIRWGRGIVWRARVRMRGFTITGSDSYVDGHAAMRWKLFGIVPVIAASGDDVARSAAGRVNIESLWLPSALCAGDVTWTAAASSLRARFTAHNETAEIAYTLDAAGALRTVSMPRWGNPGGGAFRYEECGCFVEAERTFGAYTVPARVRVGWYFGTPRFETEGEFFRAVVDDAVYRE